MGHFEKGRWIEDPIILPAITCIGSLPDIPKLPELDQTCWSVAPEDALENMVKASEKIEAMRQQIIEETKIDPSKSYLLCPSVNGYSLIELPHMRDLWGRW